MIAPYFTDGDVTIYQGDCRDLLSEMTFTTGVVIADPSLARVCTVTNPPRKKGTAAESAAATWLTGELGVTVTRGPLRGNLDRGDLFGLPLVIECKNTKMPDLKAWARELSRECANAGLERGVVLWSPPGVGLVNPGRWVAIEYSEYGDCEPRHVPHIGPLHKLHQYVTRMDECGYATYTQVGPHNVAVCRLADTWLYRLREELATPR